MAARPDPFPGAQQLYKCISGSNRITFRTGVTWRACAVHFTSCDTGYSKPWAFSAPNRAVSIPDVGRRALESLTRGHNRYLQKKDQ
jgi:hypothetical protein